MVFGRFCFATLLNPPSREETGFYLRTQIPLSLSILTLKKKELRVSGRAREECKKKKSIQLASNALFLFVIPKGIEPISKV